MSSMTWKKWCVVALCTAVCIQATFLTPYVVLVSDDRTNVFTSLLTLLPLLQYAAMSWAGKLPPISWRAVAPWAALAVGLAISAAHSAAPLASGLRALSFFAPAAGGVVGGYTFFSSSPARAYLFGLLAFCFAGLTLSHLSFGAQPSFMGLHHHALAGTLVLLSVGPIQMLRQEGRFRRAAAVGLLVAGGVACFIAGSRFVILLPFALIPVYIAFKSLSLKRALAAILASTLIAGTFFALYPEKVLRAQNYESTYYRVEAFPATWAIMKQHPLLGVGIRTPRKPFLENYQPVSGMATKAEFDGTLERNVTWDNQYLSLLCGIGVPLTLLYLYLVGRPLATYLRRAWRQEIDHATERAITFALLASVIHFAVHDGLFYPQISWFFHLLLGVGVAYLPAEADTNVTRLAGPAG
jgi:O-antigen ligase